MALCTISKKPPFSAQIGESDKVPGLRRLLGIIDNGSTFWCIISENGVFLDELRNVGHISPGLLMLTHRLTNSIIIYRHVTVYCKGFACPISPPVMLRVEPATILVL